MRALLIALAITSSLTGVSTSMGNRPTRPAKTETVTVTESNKVGDKSGWMTSIKDLDLSDITADEIILK